MAKVYPPVVIVDEQDQVIGASPLAAAWEEGSIHRTVFVIAKDRQGRILLQKRASNMRLYPDAWDISAGGHVDEGRTYEQAAHDEVQEELGLTKVSLHEVAHYFIDTPYADGTPAKRFVKVYAIELDEMPVPPDDYEVSGLAWFSLEDIAALVAFKPEQVSTGLLQVFERDLLG